MGDWLVWVPVSLLVFAGTAYLETRLDKGVSMFDPNDLGPGEKLLGTITAAAVLLLGLLFLTKPVKAMDELGINGVGICAPMPEMRIHLESQGVTADIQFPNRDWFEEPDSSVITFWSSMEGDKVVVTETDLTRDGEHTCIVIRGGRYRLIEPRPVERGNPA